MDATADELISRLKRNPEDASAFSALRAHYQRLGDFASLVNLLEGYAGRTHDVALSAHALFEAGEFAWSSLGDRVRATRLYEHALEKNPAHHDAAARLHAIYLESRDARRLIAFLEKRIEILTQLQVPSAEIAVVHQTLGETWETELDRADKAILHYRKAFELDATLVPAIYAAREIYRRAGNIKAAATLCDLEIKAEPDPARKVALLREVAHLRLHELADAESAVVALKRALTLEPGDIEVMNDLARVYLTRAAESEDAMVAEADRRRAADVLFQIAQKLAPADAVEYLETALDSAPDHDGALALLERIADRVGHFELLPPRWVAFLSRVPEGPGARERRRRLAQAYLDAGQVEYAITCLEWLLDAGDAEAATKLVDLYRAVGREDDVTRALQIATRALPVEQRVPRLREMMTTLLVRGEEEGALQAARQILEADATDGEALAWVEEHLRKRGDWSQLRDVLLGIARVPGLSVDARKQRLREVAILSERRLGDSEAATAAWKGVSALDPSDHEARTSLMRLLEAGERWDDLVQVIEREALSILEPYARAESYRRLAELHRTRRRDLREAVAAYRHLRDLLPNDTAARDALCDTLLEMGEWEDALPLLRVQISEASDDRWLELERTLALVLEERLGDDAAAFDVWNQILRAAPGDVEAIDHMVGIDERSGNVERLLGTLAERAETETEEIRATTFAAMAGLVDTELGDHDRAAELYQLAHELAPGDEAVLDSLCELYERGERHLELVKLLRERAERESDPAVRVNVDRRVARIYAEQLGNPAVAAESYRKVLDAGEDREALLFLRQRAHEEGNAIALDEYSERLADVAESAEERLEILVDRAELLSTRLESPDEARALLRELVVPQLEHANRPLLHRIRSLSERLGDPALLADCLARAFATASSSDERVALAKSLSDLCENDLGDVDRAIDSLYAWSDVDLEDAAPVRRLVPLLERRERWNDLVMALDSLADLSSDFVEKSDSVRRAAELAYRQLGDIDGAWQRLEGLVSAPERGIDAEADAQLRDLAHATDRSTQLVELYSRLAEHADTPELRRTRWLDVANIHEDVLGDAAAALEAALKALAVDMSEREVLEQVDRIGAKARAWPRLAQVYETLIRSTSDKAEKIRLLLRHAAVLDAYAGDASAALDLVLRSTALDPNDERALALAEDLAARADRFADLLVVYERRRSAATDDDSRIEAAFCAVALCERRLGQRDEALGHLEHAALVGARAGRLDVLEELVRDLDRDTRAVGQNSLLWSLADIYDSASESMDKPAAALSLSLRAAKLFEVELGSLERAWIALVRAAGKVPSNPTILMALESLANLGNRQGELDELLARFVDDALDSHTAAALLRYRGRLLEKSSQYEQAAGVYTRLRTIAPNDLESRQRLRNALRFSRKFQDLMLLLDSELGRVKGNPERELEIRIEMAQTLQHGLRLRFEALDAWKAVLVLAPEHPEALASIESIESVMKGESETFADPDWAGGELEPQRVSEPEVASVEELIVSLDEEQRSASHPIGPDAEIEEVDADVLEADDAELEPSARGDSEPSESRYEVADAAFAEVLADAEGAASVTDAVPHEGSFEEMVAPTDTFDATPGDETEPGAALAIDGSGVASHQTEPESLGVPDETQADTSTSTAERAPTGWVDPAEDAEEGVPGADGYRESESYDAAEEPYADGDAESDGYRDAGTESNGYLEGEAALADDVYEEQSGFQSVADHQGGSARGLDGANAGFGDPGLEELDEAELEELDPDELEADYHNDYKDDLPAAASGGPAVGSASGGNGNSNSLLPPLPPRRT